MIININPKDVKYLSIISGCKQTRNQRIREAGYVEKGLYLYGDWDKYLRGWEAVQNDYNKGYADAGYKYWEWLENEMKTNGYQQRDTNYVQIMLGRDGDLFLSDGRHRLFMAQKLNINFIPVDLIYIHPEYDCAKCNQFINNKVPSFIYNKIVSYFKKDCELYQTENYINDRYELLKKYLSKLRNTNILEIGCNAGFMVWTLNNVCNSWIGIERSEGHYNQCKITLDKLKDRLHNCNVYNCDLMSMPEINYDTLYLSYVLYHMTDDEIEKLRKEILPKCNKVIILNRAKARDGKNKQKLYDINNVIKLLDGFKITKDDRKDKYIVYAER